MNSVLIAIDECDETVLTMELYRRMKARQAGMCDYCGRSPHTKPACRFPERHYDIRIEQLRLSHGGKS